MRLSSKLNRTCGLARNLLPTLPLHLVHCLSCNPTYCPALSRIIQENCPIDQLSKPKKNCPQPWAGAPSRVQALRLQGPAPPPQRSRPGRVCGRGGPAPSPPSLPLPPPPPASPRAPPSPSPPSHLTAFPGRSCTLLLPPHRAPAFAHQDAACGLTASVPACLPTEAATPMRLHGASGHRGATPVVANRRVTRRRAAPFQGAAHG